MKNIYKIESSEGKLATTALSRKYGDASASAPEMLKKLAERGLKVVN